MKILLLNTYDNKGGAARASYRIAKGLHDEGVEVRFLVRRKNIQDPFIFSANEKFPGLKPYIDYLPTLVFSRKRFPFFSAIVSDNLLKIVEEYKPDIIHLNWISEGFVKIETLTKLGVPIVWTLHDSWAFTGGCHIPGNCEKYKTNCEYCQYLSPKFKHDLSYHNFKRKQKTYRQIKKLQIVTPSKWLSDNVRSSVLLGDFPVDIIPNGVDAGFFKKSNKEAAKAKFGLDQNKKTIVFGGINSIKDKNKGYYLLLDALKHLDNDDYELVIFGNSRPESHCINSIKALFLGPIRDDNILRDIYSAGDVTVVPSLTEAFGQVITESMACGTPVVAFNTTGPAEIIDHKKNGYLAEAFNPKDMADGINWILKDKQKWDHLSEDAVRHVNLNFSSDLVAKKYINLYKQLLF